MKTQPIGILDSGVGGLTVTKEILNQIPGESIIYIGDSANAPYGSKSAHEIYDRAVLLVQFLLQKKVKLIVIACNTITVQCIDQLRNAFPDTPIIGTVPVVKTAAAITRTKRIGILATSQTVQSASNQKLIKEYASNCIVYSYGTDALVPLIEKGIFSGDEIDTVLAKVLKNFQNEDIDTLALGCTHYPLIASSIQKHLGDAISLLDSGAAIARRVQKVLENNDILSSSKQLKHHFYTTGEPSVMRQIINTYGLPENTYTINQEQL